MRLLCMDKEHQHLLPRPAMLVYGRTVAVWLQGLIPHLIALGADSFESQHDTTLRDSLLAGSSKLSHRLPKDARNPFIVA